MADRTNTSQSDPAHNAGRRPGTSSRPRTSARRSKTARLDTSTSSIGELPDQTFFPEGEEDDYFDEEEEYESGEDEDVFAFARPQTAAPRNVNQADVEQSDAHDITARNTLANMTPASPTVIGSSRPTTVFATLAGSSEDAEKRPMTRGALSRVKIVDIPKQASESSQDDNDSASTFAAMDLLQRTSQPPLATLDYSEHHPQSLTRPVTDSAAVLAAARRSSNPNNTALLSSIMAQEARRQSAGKIHPDIAQDTNHLERDHQAGLTTRAPTTAQSQLSNKPSFMTTSSFDGATTDGGFSAYATDADDTDALRRHNHGFRMRNFGTAQGDELEPIPGSRDGSTWATPSEIGGATTIPDGMTTKGDGLGNLYRKWDRDDSENLGYMEETEEEDSPYEEVRASVSNIDDPEMPGKYIGL